MVEVLVVEVEVQVEVHADGVVAIVDTSLDVSR